MEKAEQAEIIHFQVLLGAYYASRDYFWFGKFKTNTISDFLSQFMADSTSEFSQTSTPLLI